MAYTPEEFPPLQERRDLSPGEQRRALFIAGFERGHEVGQRPTVLAWMANFRSPEEALGVLVGDQVSGDLHQVAYDGVAVGLAIGRVGADISAERAYGIQFENQPKPEFADVVRRPGERESASDTQTVPFDPRVGSASFESVAPPSSTGEKAPGLLDRSAGPQVER